MIRLVSFSNKSVLSKVLDEKDKGRHRNLSAREK